MNKKSLMQYKAVVFDLDGTLYYQKPFRIRMATFLLTHMIKHPASFRELLVIRFYRKLREDWETHEKSKTFPESMGLEQRQYKCVAEHFNMSADKIEQIIRFYMQEAPLKLLLPYRDNKLAGMIKHLRENGVKIVVYSDYPVIDKLQALHIQADACFTAADEQIASMKPNPKGLQVIMKHTGFDAQDMIMVGDRYEKDGMSAAANHMDYIILDTDKTKREALESTLL